jgi:CBS domain-containing protein/Flp pilus assembly pilin Flp
MEYVLLLGLLALGICITVLLFGGSIQNIFSYAAAKVPSGLAIPSDRAPGMEEAWRGSSGDAFGRAEAWTAAQERTLGHYFLGLAGIIAIVSAVGWLAWALGRARSHPKAPGINVPGPSVETIRNRAEAKRKQLWHAFLNDPEMLGQNRVRVRHVMTRDVLSISPAATREEISRKFLASRVSHLVVCDQEGAVKGVISNRDLNQRDGKTAAEIMTDAVVTITPDATVVSAISLLIERRISCLPVVKEGRLCGLVTVTDFLLTLQCALQLWLRAAHAHAQSPTPCDSYLSDYHQIKTFLNKSLAARGELENEVGVILVAVEGEPLTGSRFDGAAWLLVQCAREADYVGYLGSNTFAIVMPHSSLPTVEQLATEIREAAMSEPFASFGIRLRTVATTPQEGENADAVFARLAATLFESESALSTCDATV